MARIIYWGPFDITVTAGQTTKTQTIYPPVGRIVYAKQTISTLDNGAHTGKVALHEVGNTSAILMPDTAMSTSVSGATGVMRPTANSTGALWYTQPVDPQTGVSALVTLSDAQAGAETLTLSLAIEVN